MDKALLQRQADDESNYFPLRPSNAGKCSRALAYDLMDYLGFSECPYKEVKTPESIRLLELGKSVEYHSKRNMALVTKVDPDVRPRYNSQMVSLFRLKPVAGETIGRLIEGEIDTAIQDGEFLDILDYKSKKDKFNQAFKTDWDGSIAQLNSMQTVQRFSDKAWYVEDLPSFLNELNDEWFAYNFLQINAYSNTEWFKEHNGRNGIVYLYCKNDSRHIEVHFKPHAGLFKKLEDKFNLIYKTVLETKNPDLVPNDCILGTSSTAFSRCKDCCWKEDTLQAFFNTFPKKKWPKNAKDMGQEVQELLEAYEHAAAAAEQMYDLEKKVTKILFDKNVNKVRSDSDKIYDVKNLKTEGLVLRRGKL